MGLGKTSLCHQHECNGQHRNRQHRDGQHRDGPSSSQHRHAWMPRVPHQADFANSITARVFSKPTFATSSTGRCQ